MGRAYAGSIGLLLASLLAACAMEPTATEDVDAEEDSLWAVVDKDSTGTPRAVQAGDDEGVPGEAAPGEPVDLAGCSHIQWCDEPGPVGTVCIWDACSLSAAVAECTQDANFVCGGIKQPAEIR